MARTILRRQVRPVKRIDCIRDTDRFSLTPAGEVAMNAANTAQEPAQSVQQVTDGLPVEPKDCLPKPEWVRGTCPQCGGALVANAYYVGGRGYLMVSECWNSLPEPPLCSYRRVL